MELNWSIWKLLNLLNESLTANSQQLQKHLGGVVMKDVIVKNGKTFNLV
jgi:hypothetical protein